MDEKDNAQVLKLYPKPDEFVLISWDNVSWLRDGEIVTRAEFEALATEPGAILVVVQHTRPYQVGA